MRINKYNAEGYYDPTAYEALSVIVEHTKKKRAYLPLVYVCSPLAGDVENNQAKARSYCRFVVDQGGIPLAPHLLFPQFMSDENEEERDLALFMDIVLLSKCSEIWVFGDTISRGMAIEIERARRNGQKIRFIALESKEA